MNKLKPCCTTTPVKANVNWIMEKEGRVGHARTTANEMLSKISKKPTKLSRYRLKSFMKFMKSANRATVMIVHTTRGAKGERVGGEVGCHTWMGFGMMSSSK